MAANSPKNTTAKQFCSAPNCFNQRTPETTLEFHSFPEDEERRKQWVHNSRRLDLLKMPSMLPNHVICSDHFEMSQYPEASMGRNLIKLAIPTVFNYQEPPPFPIAESQATPKELEVIVKAADGDEIRTMEMEADNNVVVCMNNSEAEEAQDECEDPLSITPLEKIKDSPSKESPKKRISSPVLGHIDDSTDIAAGSTVTSPLTRSSTRKKDNLLKKRSLDRRNFGGTGSTPNSKSKPKPRAVSTSSLLAPVARVKASKISQKEAKAREKMASIEQVIKVEVETLYEEKFEVKTENPPLLKSQRRSRGKPPIDNNFIYEWHKVNSGSTPGPAKRKKAELDHVETPAKKKKGALKDTDSTSKTKGKEQNFKGDEFLETVGDDIVLSPDRQSPRKKNALASPKKVKEETVRYIPETNKLTKKNHRMRDNEFDLEEDVSYAVLTSGTQRGHKRLVGSDGYTYNLRLRENVEHRYDWRCSYRPSKNTSCLVIVRQYPDTGIFKKKGIHLHDPKPASFINSLVSSQVKKRSKLDFINKPKEIVQEILQENADLISESGCKFNVDYLVRNFNRRRLEVKKKNPNASSLKFGERFPENFLQEDILFKDRRHMVFATPKQLQVLARCDRWYIDITRKFVSQPFKFLLSISAFVTVEDSQRSVKLKPLVFVCMTSILCKDFAKAIRGVLKHLRKPLVVRSFVLDYYEELWSAVRSLFFNCKIYGCAWKFGQCVWAKIQQSPLKEEHMEMYDQIHKLLKLPFLPPKEIRLTFQLLKDEFLNRPAFKEIVGYIESTWLDNPVWRIRNWSVYASPFRTKAEVIGWHYSVRVQEKGSHYHNLVRELHRIASSVSSSARPVHQLNVRRFYSSNIKTPQGKIFNLWEEESVMSHSEFLMKCCQLSEPVMEGMVDRMIQEYRTQMKEYS